MEWSWSMKFAWSLPLQRCYTPAIMSPLVCAFYTNAFAAIVGGLMISLMHKRKIIHSSLTSRPPRAVAVAAAAAAADFASLISRAPHTGFNVFRSFRPAVIRFSLNGSVALTCWLTGLSCSQKWARPKAELNLLPDITHRANDVDPWDGPQIGQNEPRLVFHIFSSQNKTIRPISILMQYKNHWKTGKSVINLSVFMETVLLTNLFWVRRFKQIYPVIQISHLIP